MLAMLCLVALMLAHVAWGVRLGGALGVMAYAWFCLHADGRRRIANARWHEDGSWSLELADGQRVRPRLGGARVLGPAIFLRFTWSERSRASASVSLWPDNTDPDTRRRLRVRLRALSGE